MLEKQDLHDHFAHLSWYKPKAVGYMATCKQVHMCAYHSYQTGTLLEIQEAPDLVPELSAICFL